MSRNPLPDEHFPEAREQEAEHRAQLWSDVDDLGRAAWAAWRRVRGQVSILNPNAEKAEHLVTVLDSSAVIWSLGAEGIPAPAQSMAWDYVMAAHDVEYHGAENLTRLCVIHVYGEQPEPLDPTCARCLKSIGVRAEDVADG